MGSLGYYSKLSFQAREEVIPKKNFCLQSQMTIEPLNHGTMEPLNQKSQIAQEYGLLPADARKQLKQK